MVKSRAFFAIGLAGGVMLLTVLMALRGYENTWRLWNIPASGLRFMDAQVFGAAATTYAEGRDPLRENPHDVSERRLNYPRIWQLLFWAGFKSGHAEALGACFVVCFLVGLWLVMPPLTKPEAAVLMPAVFSPAVLLGVERGNSDLAMFFLLALATIASRAFWVATWVTLAFMLKLYPLAGLAVLFARPREQARRAAGIVLAFSLLYACFILRDLILMEAATPRGAWIAYGWQVPVLWFAEAGGRPDPVVLFAAGVLLVMVLLGSIRIGARMSGNSITASGRRLDAFRMGAACYAGSFLLGSSFQYRLIFLLPALPQLLEWGAQAGPFRGYARTGVGAALLSLWALGLDGLLRPWPVGGAAGFWAEQAANWILLAVSMILLTATLPGWAVGQLQRWMSTRVLPTGVPQRNEPR